MKMNQQTSRRLIQDKPGITVEFECRFQKKNGRKNISTGKDADDPPPSSPALHIPRTTKLLAPEIQQEILFLLPGKPLPQQVKERNMRKALKTLVWKEQREIWKTL